jgi:hypothetical protein
MLPSDPSARRKPKGDFTALALMIGMVLAVAVTGGAALSSAGSGTLQQTLRSLGFGREGEIAAEQRKHATALAEIERIIGRMDREIGGLSTRMARTEASDMAAKETLDKLDDGFTALGADMKELRARGEAAEGEAWRKPVDHLNAAVAGTRGDIISLRSSLDAYEQTRRGEIGAISRRIDRLEKTLMARDAVASVPDGPLKPAPRETETAPAGGLRGLFGLRGSGATEPGQGHVIDMGRMGH